MVVEEEEFVRILMDAAEGKTPREREGEGRNGREWETGTEGETAANAASALSLSRHVCVLCLSLCAHSSHTSGVRHIIIHTMSHHHVYHFVHTVATHQEHHTYYGRVQIHPGSVKHPASCCTHQECVTVFIIVRIEGIEGTAKP